jgi:Transcriptional regulatory protein, C terminal
VIKYFFTSIAIIAWLTAVVSFVNRKNDMVEKHLEVVLRAVGHQLLLHANDSTSRVLPIERIKENTYQIAFQNAFAFVPDTLINVVHRELSKTMSPQNYILNVVKCEDLSTVFAYEINTLTANITPCLGRAQMKDCYLVQITFSPTPTMDFSLVLLCLLPLGIAAFYLINRFWRNGKVNINKKNLKIVDDEVSEKIKKYPSALEGNIVSLGDLRIELTEKEAKAFQLFVDNINQTIPRKILMKTLWEDEGVFVIDRNLDVLVSKLRKKLAEDPAIKIINVHGKGYKMTVSDLS